MSGAGSVNGVSSTNTFTWTYTGPALTSLTNGTSYQIQSQATNSYGEVQTAPSVFSFIFNNALPSIAILAPNQNAVYASLPTISGTSADNIVKVSTISLNIAQAGGGCFSPRLANFTAACPNPFPAQGTTTAWSYSGITWVSGQQYTLSATASDAFGNSILASNNFNFYVSTGLSYGIPGDGQGSASIAPTSAGCQLVTTTITYTAGRHVGGRRDRPQYSDRLDPAARHGPRPRIRSDRIDERIPHPVQCGGPSRQYEFGRQQLDRLQCDHVLDSRAERAVHL
jgi:hypothetical protein